MTYRLCRIRDITEVVVTEEPLLTRLNIPRSFGICQWNGHAGGFVWIRIVNCLLQAHKKLESTDLKKASRNRSPKTEWSIQFWDPRRVKKCWKPVGNLHFIKQLIPIISIQKPRNVKMHETHSSWSYRIIRSLQISPFSTTHDLEKSPLILVSTSLLSNRERQ